jgi:hypothetical protein
MRRDDTPKPEANEELKRLLDLNADKFLHEDMPKLYATIRSDIEAGRTKADILERCADIKGMNEYVMNSIEMTIDYLLRELDELSRSNAIH